MKTILHPLIGMFPLIKSPASAWGLVLVASLFEVAFALGLKYTDGFTRLWPSIGTIVAGVVSFVLLSRASPSCRSAPPTPRGRDSARSARRPWVLFSFVNR